MSLNQPNPLVNSVSVLYAGEATTTSVILYDTVSFVCGNGDGLTYCGNRNLKIIDVSTGK